MSEEIPGYAIGRLSLQPGDVLVVKCNNIGAIKKEWADNIRDVVRREIGDIPAIIIGDDVDLAVLTKAEIDSRVEPVRAAPGRIIELPEA